MKKLVLLLIILLFPIFVNAKEYKVDDMTIRFDEKSWTVLEREKLNESQYLKDLEYNSKDIEELKRMMVNRDLDLQAILNSIGVVNIYCKPTDGEQTSNLNYQTEEMINSFIKNIQKQTNTPSVKEEIINGYKYLVYEFSSDEGNAINYFTYMNGKGFTIQFLKEDDLNDSDRTIIKEIVKTISFKKDWRYSLTPDKKRVRDNIIQRTLTIGGAIIGGVVAGIIGKKVREKEQKRNKKKKNHK